MILETVGGQKSHIFGSGIVFRVGKPCGVGELCIFQSYLSTISIHLKDEQSNRVSLIFAIVKLLIALKSFHRICRLVLFLIFCEFK